MPLRQDPISSTPNAEVHKVPSGCVLTEMLGRRSLSKQTYWHGLRNRMLGNTKEHFGGVARAQSFAGIDEANTATDMTRTQGTYLPAAKFIFVRGV